jgi:hypothetical protein
MVAKDLLKINQKSLARLTGLSEKRIHNLSKLTEQIIDKR